MKAAELIVPIPELEDGSPDWRVVQQVEMFQFLFSTEIMTRFGGTWRMWWHALSRRTSIRLISPSRTGRVLCQ